MTSVTIPHPREDSTIIVKAAFEASKGIKTYHDNGITITGKTGGRMGLLASSYGEQISVEIPQNQPSETETMVSVTGKKEVSTNIGADPDKYVSQVVWHINDIKNGDIEDILSVLEENGVESNNKEVNSVSNQAGGKGMVIIVMLILFFFVFLMPLMIL
jgi:hypothetical protein